MQEFYIDQMPPKETSIWGYRRKAVVVFAVMNRHMTKDDVCKFYGLTHEELNSWIDGYTEKGLQGLKSTKVQERSRQCLPPQ
jgi:hypothetical protein